MHIQRLEKKQSSYAEIIVNKKIVKQQNKINSKKPKGIFSKYVNYHRKLNNSFMIMNALNRTEVKPRLEK